MSDETPESKPPVRPLPERPDLEWLRKQAKRQLEELRRERRTARLAEAQFQLARELKDSKHGGDAFGWAAHFGQPMMAQMLRGHRPS